MSDPRYVPQGAFLVCDKGVKPSTIRSFSNLNTFVYGENMCTAVDKLMVVNFDGFGACASCQGAPCTAPVTLWNPVTTDVFLGGSPLLLDNSVLPCTLGGVIRIFFSLREAMAAIAPPEQGFWGDLLDAAGDALDVYVDFSVGVAEGLWTGLKGTVVGIFDLAVWAGKHTPAYALLNPEGFKEQLAKDKETIKALGGLAKKGATWAYRNSTINLITNPDDFYAAQQENAEMVDGLLEKASNMSARDWGNVVGQVLFEVGLEVATGGLGGAARVADKSVDLAQAANRADNIVDAAKLAENADDVADAAKNANRADNAADANKAALGQPEKGEVIYVRDWKEIQKLFKRGNDFNRKARESGWYPFYEIHLSNGKRLDSYDEMFGEIVSRKATNFDDIKPSTFEKYLKEIDSKYSPGTKIRSNKYPELDGQYLQGQKILEVPDVNQNSPNKAIFEAKAAEYDVVIRYRPE